MSIASDMKTALSGVVNALAETGWSWSTTYGGTYAAINVLPTALQSGFEQADTDETDYSGRVIRVATDGVSSLPAARDWVKDPDGVYWRVMSISSDGYGSRSYAIERGEISRLGQQRGRVR